MTPILKLWEAQVKKAFLDLAIPSDDFLKLQKDPIRWRDEYFFNNGVKALAASCRQSIEKKDEEIRELKLKLLDK